MGLIPHGLLRVPACTGQRLPRVKPRWSSGWPGTRRVLCGFRPRPGWSTRQGCGEGEREAARRGTCPCSGGARDYSSQRAGPGPGPGGGRGGRAGGGRGAGRRPGRRVGGHGVVGAGGGRGAEAAAAGQPVRGGRRLRLRPGAAAPAGGRLAVRDGPQRILPGSQHPLQPAAASGDVHARQHAGHTAQLPRGPGHVLPPQGLRGVPDGRRLPASSARRLPPSSETERLDSGPTSAAPGLAGQRLPGSPLRDQGQHHPGGGKMRRPRTDGQTKRLHPSQVGTAEPFGGRTLAGWRVVPERPPACPPRPDVQQRPPWEGEAFHAPPLSALRKRTPGAAEIFPGVPRRRNASVVNVGEISLAGHRGGAPQRWVSLPPPTLSPGSHRGVSFAAHSGETPPFRRVQLSPVSQKQQSFLLKDLCISGPGLDILGAKRGRPRLVYGPPENARAGKPPLPPSPTQGRQKSAWLDGQTKY